MEDMILKDSTDILRDKSKACRESPQKSNISFHNRVAGIRNVLNLFASRHLSL